MIDEFFFYILGQLGGGGGARLKVNISVAKFLSLQFTLNLFSLECAELPYLLPS